MSALTVENNVLTAHLHRDHHDYDHVSEHAQAVLNEHTRDDDVTVYGRAAMNDVARGSTWGRPYLSDLFGILARYNDLTVVFDLATGRGEIAGANQDPPSASVLPVQLLRGDKATLWADWTDSNAELNHLAEDPAWTIAAMSDDFASMVLGISQGHVTIVEQVPYTQGWMPYEIGFHLLVSACEDLGLDKLDPTLQRALGQLGRTWNGSLSELVHVVTVATAA